VKIRRARVKRGDEHAGGVMLSGMLRRIGPATN